MQIDFLKIKDNYNLLHKEIAHFNRLKLEEKITDFKKSIGMIYDKDYKFTT